MGNQNSYLLRIILFSGDLLALNVVLVLLMPFSGLFFHNPFNSLALSNILTYNLCWLIAASCFRLYRLDTLVKLEKILRQSIRTLLLFCGLYAAAIVLRYNAKMAYQLLTLSTVLLCFFILVSRFFLTYIMDFVIHKGNLSQKIAIVGYNETAIRLASYFREQNNLYSFEGFFHARSENAMMVDKDGTIIRPLATCVDYAIKNDIREIFSTLLPDDHDDINHLVAMAEKNCVRVKFVPSLLYDETIEKNLAAHELDYVNNIAAIGLKSEPLYSYENRFKKRAFDIVFSSLVIVFIISWLAPIIALLIKLESRGPVFFKQLRTGKNNKPFYCYKFRSMRVNAHSDHMQASLNDSRITSLGKFLRKTSLDEFPQFFNVLLGNMSIVGPRPHMLKHTEQYSDVIDRYMVRQFLKPGITGWAQVSGYRGETRNPMLMQKRVEHDIWYMERWSNMLDIRIIFLTLINVFKGEERAF